MATVEILLCGGPGHGKWLEVPTQATAHAIRRVTPKVASPFAAIEDFKLSFEDHRYYIEPVVVNSGGAPLWVGVHHEVGPRDKERVVAKALFQRDVYSRMYPETGTDFR